jgi:rubrerythrin
MPIRAIPTAQDTVDVSDPVGVLNYALTLEHLENAFYRDGLDQFDEAAFEEAGVGPARERLVQIGEHEQEHVDTLTQVVTDLGGEPVEEGEYLFDDAFVDVATFLATAQVFENTGVSAYQGAAQYLIEEDELLTAALNIHSVEARHAAYLNGLNGVTPFPAAVDTPLSPDEVVGAITPFLGGEAEAEATPEA